MVEQGVRTAIDISDGLISDLKHVCKTSRVGARIEVDYTPVSPAVKVNFEEFLELALSGGEGYELLFTGNVKVIDNVKKLVSCPITVIGEIVAEKIGEITLVGTKGSLIQPGNGGWEHFTAR